MKVIITVHPGIDKHALLHELEADGYGVIASPCSCVDHMHHSQVNMVFDLDPEDFDKLRNDPRVMDVEDYDHVLNVPMQLHDTRTITPAMYYDDPVHDNWAFERCTKRTGYNVTTANTNTTFRWSHEGDGVDVVIIDTGIRLDHEEFKDEFGVSRIQQIEWEAGMLTSKPNFYTDQVGHGTHVASTVAGLTQGWAPKARIYVMKLHLDITSYDDYTSALTALQLVHAWHNAKSGPDAGRPTICNNSWGYYWQYPSNYPDANFADFNHPYSVSSVNAEITSMVNDGIVFVAAAGNDSHYIANTIDSQYSDGYWTDAGGNYVTPTDPSKTTFYYLYRATPAGADNAICVGATGYLYLTPPLTDETASFSNYGSRIDVWSPGFYIQGADFASSTGLIKKSGTSMASPNVSGMLAQLLGAFPTLTHAQVLDWISDLSVNTVVSSQTYNPGRPGLTKVMTNSTTLMIFSPYMGIYVKDAGTWKLVMQPSIKDSGVWKLPKEVHIKDSGSWYKVYG